MNLKLSKEFYEAAAIEEDSSVAAGLPTEKFNLVVGEVNKLLRESQARRDAAIYHSGALKAIWLFAHWKDGVQYVGTSGMTLRQVEERINDLLPPPNFDDKGEPTT